MEPPRYFFKDEPRWTWPATLGEAYPGLRARPDRGERAAALARDLLGSWPCLGAILILLIAGATLADMQDHHVGAVVVLDLIVSGLTLAAVSMVLMATRHLDRIADEQVLHDRATARRAQAVREEILDQLEEINSGLARLTARIEIFNIRCRAGGEDGP